MTRDDESREQEVDREMLIHKQIMALKYAASVLKEIIKNIQTEQYPVTSIIEIKARSILAEIEKLGVEI